MRPTGADAGKSIHERLFNEQQHKVALLQQREQEKVELELEGCTFNPQVIDDNASINGDGNNVVSPSRVVDEAELVARLAADRTGIQLLRDEIKKQKELEACTFKPRVRHYHQENSLTMGQNDAEEHDERNRPVYERLNNEIKDLATRNKLRESRELEGCTFTPAIGRDPSPQPIRRRSSSNNGIPSVGRKVFTRLSGEASTRREKEVSREKLKFARETEGCSFAPDVRLSEGIDGVVPTGASGTDRILKLSVPQKVSTKREEIEAKWAQQSQRRKATTPRRNRPASAGAGRTRSPSSQSTMRGGGVGPSMATEAAAAAAAAADASQSREDFNKWQEEMHNKMNML
jgi:hypothetical protein